MDFPSVGLREGRMQLYCVNESLIEGRAVLPIHGESG